MYFVDRSVAVIKPKQPFADWLNQAPDNELELSLESLRADCTVLLIPEFDEPEEGVAYLDEIADKLFEMELSTWYDDPAVWPTDRSLKAFWEWFDVEIHSTLIDTLDADLENSPI